MIQLVTVEDDGENLGNEDVSDELQRFWEVESADDPEDVKIMQEFRETVHFNGLRYVAELPLKDPSEFIPDHYQIALRRLQSLHANLLEKNVLLKEEYYNVFQQYEEENIIEKVYDSGVPGKVHYLPHRPVVRTDKATTKVRPVFDASAHERGGKSLNDYLHTGPSLLCQIVDIIIRVCFKKIVVIADIRQAFLNVEIWDEHKDLLRFLLLDKDCSNVQAYRFNRGCFGVNCLPFILCATIMHHMDEMKKREVGSIPLIDQFLRDLYMDDETTAVNSVEEGKEFYDFARKAMEEAGLDLRKWDSNSEELRRYMKCTEEEKEMKKVLGLLWNQQDEFVFDFTDAVAVASNSDVTKLSILSFGSKLFDPAGWIAPIIAVARMYFQRACKARYSWKETIKDELQKGWLKYLQHLAEIKCIRISRYLFSSIIDVAEDIELHGYCDSSEQA